MIKRLVLLIVATLILFGFWKVGSYYSQNRLYFHYLLDAYWEGRKSVVEDGYTDRTSYLPGEEQQVYVNATSRRNSLLRLYDINGAVVDSVQVLVQPQEAGPNPSEEGYGYKATFTYRLPDLPSGIYLWEKKIPFTLKAENAEVVVVYSSNTVNAYNISGGKSLYKLFSEKTHVVSFQRPMLPAVSFFAEDGLKWLKSTSYNINYINDQDLDIPGILAGAKVVLIIGHSEYWSRRGRRQLDEFIDKGGHCMILSGNTMWWQVRYSTDGTKLICYKEKPDPIAADSLKSTFWNNPVLHYPLTPSIGADFSRAGYGRKSCKGFGGYKILKPDSPVFQGLLLKEGDVLQVSTKEYDGAPLKGQEPDLRLDKAALGFYKAELLGYDRAVDAQEGFATFILFQKTPASGVVLNTATTDWCGAHGIGGPDSLAIRKITSNVLEAMLSNKNLFTEAP
ncbi:N,N-dimethylformamidase beta subunit family domain-containing protein [Pontibacter beigongshangensis]|uniref:N,N-dimethylformamidase beta subunit family domain-containing protein n=1 Tax=Pontibacter beigongshangensis TaxID=2574733 RepID=UPI00164F8E6D|nr:N,N-dimethylformamidase beta subunit family domain-containing protein [Pontibacter beigongshangensis]